MPNTVNYAIQFEPDIKQKYTRELLTADLTTQNVNFVGANRIRIPYVTVSGYKDHSRNGGFNRGSVENDFMEKTLGFDRDIEFFVDSMDVDESNQALSAANIFEKFDTLNEDTELARIGTDDYLLTINENPIAALYSEQVASFVLRQMQNTKYIPCEWKRIGGDPSLQLGDIITIIDNKETFNEEHYSQYDKYPLYMTGRSWTYNVGGFSDRYTASGNAERDLNTDRGMTQSKRVSQLAKRITETKKDLTAEMDSRQEFLLLFNETIAASMGFYTTCVEDENGAVIQYMHDKPLLEESGTIYTKGINGFAWTNDGWNNGNPLWEYGFDKNGNAILNQIYAYTLTADVITSGLLQSKNGASWIDMDTGEFSFSAAEIIETWYDEDGVHNEYEYNKVLELANKVLSVYGILKSLNYPELSVSIGESENGNLGAFTVTDNQKGYGDLFQVYAITAGNEKGVVLTSPFLINSAKTNRKGISVLPNKITLFNDAGALSGNIAQFSLDNKKALMTNGNAYIEQINSDIRISNEHSANAWINYDTPNYGYTPTKFYFGDGSKGGTADVRMNTCICNGLQVLSGTAGSEVAYITSAGAIYTKDRAYIEKSLSIGCGTKYDLNYPLWINGQAKAEKWVVTSDRNLKENIKSKDDLNAIEKISQLKFYSYDFKKSGDEIQSKSADEIKKLKSDDKTHIEIGIMADEAPEEIRSSDENGVDLYSYLSLVAKSTQELIAMVEKQQKEIEELKAKLNENR